MTIRATEAPPGSLLARYAASGAFTDCYATELPFAVTHAEFVEAFYTTLLFKAERLVLQVLLDFPSTDAQARELAHGRADSFAAWTVESRADHEILLAAGRTRSWLMVAPGHGPPPVSTRLLFGSAILPQPAPAGSRPGRGLAFRALSGFHVLYSRALLAAARGRLARQSRRRGA